MSEHYFIGVSSCYTVITENEEITTDISQAKYHFMRRDQVSTQTAQF